MTLDDPTPGDLRPGDLPPGDLTPGEPLPAEPTSGAPSGRSFEQRASLTFKVLAGFAALVTALAVPALSGGPSGPIVKALTFGGAILLVGVLIAAATGLDRLRPWAVAAARPLVGLMLLTGYGGAVIALGQGRVTFPLDGLLATWAVFGTPEVRPTPRLRGRAIGIVAVYLATILATSGAATAFGPGGLLDVHERDLVATISADCGTTGAGPPPAIDVTYAWQWRRTSPLATGLDMVVVTWSGRDDTGRSLYVLGDVPDAAGGVYPGVSSDPSTNMAQAIAQGADGSWEWGIELSEQQLAPGQIHVRLVRAMVDAPPPAPGPFEIQASYIHQGVWRDQMTEIACSW